MSYLSNGNQRGKIVSGNVPNAGSAATITGSGIDRLGYESAQLHVASGTASGSPDAQTVDAYVQESSDNSSFTNISGAAITQITADSTQESVDIDLRAVKRYLKVVTVVAFTNGSSPKLPVASTLWLTGANSEPVTGA
jgi:hypothetical protein